MWEPKDCCCCCSRKTGCLVLGGLGVAFALLSIISDIHAFTTVSVVDMADGICTEPQFSHFENCRKIVPNIVMWVMVSHFVGAVICLMAYSMLIHGVNKKIPCLMMPSMVLMLIKIIFASLLGLLLVILMISGHVPSHMMVFDVILVSLFLATFIWTYILLVVRSHYREMRCENAEDHRVLIEEPVSEKELIGKGLGY